MWPDLAGPRPGRLGNGGWLSIGKSRLAQGYATEAAQACRNYAFQKLGQREVFSIIRDNNLPSQEVARQKWYGNRGQFIKHYYGIDMPHLIFSVRRKAEDEEFLH